MARSLPNHLMNNLSLSMLALVLSFGIWHSLSRNSKTYATTTATIYFYNESNKKITAPEQLPVTLYGKRSELKKLLYTTTVHIDLKNYGAGNHTVMIAKEMFNVPDDSILINYRPKLVIDVQPAQ